MPYRMNAAPVHPNLGTGVCQCLERLTRGSGHEVIASLKIPAEGVGKGFFVGFVSQYPIHVCFNGFP